MTKTRVVHVRYEPYDELVARPGPLGNPYVIGIDGDREQVIAKFIDYLPTRPDLMQRACTRTGLRLGCYCKAPGHEMECHGDHIALLSELVG